MRYPKLLTTIALAAAVGVTACNRTEPTPEADGSVAGSAVDPDIEERTEETAELEKRVAEVERRFTEMQAEVKEENRTPTAGLREEVKEDVTNVREAVANLKTTSPENWWDRYEQAMERNIQDIEADVQRFAKGKPAPQSDIAGGRQSEPVGTSGTFEDRRNQFVDRLKARVDAMEDRLGDVKADGAVETELQDTRARIDKLQDDLDRLRTVSADDWWDVSAERVREYIDRVEKSIGRLDNDRA